MTKPNKEWIESVIKKAPICDTSYEVMCADMLIHFGRAVECVNNEQLNIRRYCKCRGNKCSVNGDKFNDCVFKAIDNIVCDGLPIHIARIFVSYCGWVKGMTLDKDYLSCLFVGEFNPDIKELLSAIFSIGEKSSISDEFISFAKAHKIDLVEAVEIMIREQSDNS